MASILLLGLLIRNGAMSGYDIQVALENSQTDKWAYVKPASIYYALKKMHEKGFLSLDGIEKTGHRTKAIYSITDTGVKEYKRLLKVGLEKTSVIFPAELYTSLTFIDDLPKEKALDLIEKQFLNIKIIYNDMKSIKILKKEIGHYPENVEIIFENMFKQCEIQLETLNLLKKHLDKTK
ncbi:MAG: PadR family transcriptional regulator [Sarcina sp.]